MEKRNGVLNYTYFIKSIHLEESAFPVKKNYLKEYLTYKVEECKMTAQTLKLYIINIKAHNKALGFALPFNSYNPNSLDINTTDTFPFPTGIDSVIQEVYSQPNTNINQNILTNNIPYNLNSFHTYPFLLLYIDVRNILSNNSISCKLYDSSSSSAHTFLLPSINDLNTVYLLIDTDSYI
ncbi:22469_t:CDS:2 [Dentiscutata erythropus]|uniref:22469_t:CDS:1 n=1 Tax=Dentiscutata erythropus TaxID=1348616 RepID=A0A9N8ZAN4_9GLOM|nr:22469_t:CDS:2 [Dentiscutata erythropus]